MNIATYMDYGKPNYNFLTHNISQKTTKGCIACDAPSFDLSVKTSLLSVFHSIHNI